MVFVDRMEPKYIINKLNSYFVKFLIIYNTIYENKKKKNVYVPEHLLGNIWNQLYNQIYADVLSQLKDHLHDDDQ